MKTTERTMDTISSFLAHDHEHCDDLFTRAERSAGRRDWSAAAVQMRCFSDALDLHIAMEEQVLFPGFERTLAHAREPVAMLRTEHLQMRMLARRLTEAADAHALSDFVLHSETFALLRQQHSAKEDQLLYPFLDQVLAFEREAVLTAMQAVRGLAAPA
jgi:hemerythrin-like domain-containing protein